MLYRVICVLCVALVAECWAESKGKGQIWAVLVAGSNTYSNYRHQADVCHAYQILHRHGVPDSNIIVMMYDDIANNPDNPTPGVIINKPGGTNVYGPKKVPKDYTGENVTPQNFIHVLTGNSAAVQGKGSGKVLKSGPNDHVFVNFVDHGAPGIIGFPSSMMHAGDLIKALKTMHKKKMYKKLVFYLESCESGSMFHNILPNNINIFATTAANPAESSYACYWDDDLQTYLGDEYSVAWMEDIDSEEHHKNLTTETLVKQFSNVVKRVTESHPRMYGEKSIKKDRVRSFLGAGNNKKTFHSETETKIEPFKDSVSSRDVVIETLRRRITLAKKDNDADKLQTQLQKMIQGRREVDALVGRILAHVTSLNIPDINELEGSRHPLSTETMPCYRTLVDAFNENCVNVSKNTYALVHLYKFLNLCSLQYSSAEEVTKAFSAECTGQHRALNNIH